MSHRIKTSCLVLGHRDGWNIVSVGRYQVYMFRIVHTDTGRSTFERQMNRRGVEYNLVTPDGNESVYEVTGELESLKRLSKERVVIGSPWFSTDSPIPFGRNLRIEAANVEME